MHAAASTSTGQCRDPKEHAALRDLSDARPGNLSLIVAGMLPAIIRLTLTKRIKATEGNDPSSGSAIRLS
jgi:hypothetical protein